MATIFIQFRPQYRRTEPREYQLILIIFDAIGPFLFAICAITTFRNITNRRFQLITLEYLTLGDNRVFWSYEHRSYTKWWGIGCRKIQKWKEKLCMNKCGVIAIFQFWPFLWPWLCRLSLSSKIAQCCFHDQFTSPEPKLLKKIENCQLPTVLNLERRKTRKLVTPNFSALGDNGEF